MTDRVIDQSYLCQSSQIGFLFTGDTIDLHKNGWKEGQRFHSVTKGRKLFYGKYTYYTLRNLEASHNKYEESQGDKQAYSNKIGGLSTQDGLFVVG